VGNDPRRDAGDGLNPERVRHRLRSGPPVLYALIDSASVSPGRWLSVAEALLEARVDLVQLRAKLESPRELLEPARSVVQLLQPQGIPVLINDRVDLALAADAAGAHLGAEDLAPRAARALLGPEAILGLTAPDPRREAPELVAVDYLGVGAMFPTATKSDTETRGPAALTAARAASTLPLVAIGGIDPTNCAELAGFGAAGVAVSSALSEVPRIPSAVRAFRQALATW